MFGTNVPKSFVPKLNQWQAKTNLFCQYPESQIKEYNKNIKA